MRSRFRFFAPILLVFLLSCAAPAGALAQILINEFIADPVRDWDGDGTPNYRDDEWIEIVNAGTVAVDLAGYRLADGEGAPVWRYEFAGTLEPAGVRIAYGSDSRAWEEAKGFPVYGLSLNNSGDRIGLYRVTAAETLLVDAVVYAGIACAKDRSIGRRAEEPGLWAAFDAYNPCTSRCDPPGTGCAPTPNTRNGCQTAVESSSWGTIKAKYR